MRFGFQKWNIPIRSTRWRSPIVGPYGNDKNISTNVHFCCMICISPHSAFVIESQRVWTNNGIRDHTIPNQLIKHYTHVRPLNSIIYRNIVEVVVSIA